jgi:hypothetical protein
VARLGSANLFTTSKGWSNVTGTALGATVSREQMLVFGNVGDVLEAGSGWTQAGTAANATDYAGMQFVVYNNTALQVQLLVANTLPPLGG